MSTLHHAVCLGSEWNGRPTLQIATLAVVVALLASLAAAILHALLSAFQSLSSAAAALLSSFLGAQSFVLLPAIGGLLVGLMVNRLAKEAMGAGVSHIRSAVLFEGGRVRPRVAAVKLLATALLLGSGGSAGVVGPMAQVGGTLGSALGQRLRLPDSSLKVLLASGTAAGIAAIINAPAAGFLFAMEVVLGEFSLAGAWPVALSAAVAGVTAKLTRGSDPLLAAPSYLPAQPVELLLYLLLGLLAAWVGVAFTYGLDWVEKAFARCPMPDYLAPALGGLMVGVIGAAFPQVFGLGYPTITAALAAQLPLALMASLVVAKLAATCLSVGSGGSGGVVGPSLWMGAVLGGFVGGVVHSALPEATAASGAYALVGMAAVFAAAFHAPITAVVLVAELTGGHTLILPLVVACAASNHLACRISPHAIYSLSPSHRGIYL